MLDECNWFEVIKHKDYLYVIREKLEDIDPRFHTVYTNLYLLLGSDSALLIDTGCGIFPLKPIVQELIGDRRLIVINTHSHWDHILSNNEFSEIYIHQNEARFISNPINISNLKDSSKDIVKVYEKYNFSIPPSSVIKTIDEGDKFDLGGYIVDIIHTPGHSPGSISLFTNKNEVFTGDLAHYGAVYLPKKNNFPEVLSSLSKLMNMIKVRENIKIFPSHEEFGIDINLLEDLYKGIENIENLWSKRQKDDFNFSWIIDDNKFKYVISRI
jgi:glyoxylase-like metal-dependent hydrolase (beta-lactamase superfamily II)